MWFIGDDLLEQSANSLRKLKNEPIFDAAKPELFIYREYSVQAFHDNEVKTHGSLNNPIRKIRNNLAMAFNQYPAILPQYLIVILGNSYIHDQVFIEFEFKAILKRILNDIGRLIATRREQIPKRASNTGLHPTEVFIIRPLPKPEAALRGNKKFKNARRYVNQMLDKLSSTYDFKPLNIDEINTSQKALFEKSGLLSEYGQERMWFSISEFIRKKDSQLAIMVRKACASKEDVGTQFPEVNFYDVPEKVEEYMTSNRRADYNGTYRQHGGNRSFDSYHCEYDRPDYYDRHGYHHQEY